MFQSLRQCSITRTFILYFVGVSEKLTQTILVDLFVHERAMRTNNTLIDERLSISIKMEHIVVDNISVRFYISK